MNTQLTNEGMHGRVCLFATQAVHRIFFQVSSVIKRASCHMNCRVCRFSMSHVEPTTEHHLCEDGL